MRLIVLFLCLGATLLSQSYKPTYQSNQKLNLDTVLAGVKHVIVRESKEYQKQIDEGKRKEYGDALRKYLKFLGFESIGLTTKEKGNIIESVKSSCDIVYLNVYWDYTDSNRILLQLVFTTCNDDSFEFEFTYIGWGINRKSGEELFGDFLYRWKQMYQRKKAFYDVKHRLSLPKLPTNWTEKTLKEYFNGPQVDSLEGIYEKMRVNLEDTDPKYRIAVVKTDNLSYNVIYLAGANYPDDWKEGEIKAVLNKSAIPNYYKVDWYMSNKDLNKDVFLQRTPEGILEFLFTEDGPSRKSSYLKTYPVKW